MKELSDIIPESEKTIFKPEKVNKKELEKTLNTQVGIVIERIIKRDV